MVLTPAIIEQVAAWIAALISAAPKVEVAVRDIIAFVKNLFGAGVIDKETQDDLLAYVDKVALAFLKDEPPPAWTVEPDPPTPAVVG
jgi:hypothetical protein